MPPASSQTERVVAQTRAQGAGSHWDAAARWGRVLGYQVDVPPSRYLGDWVREARDRVHPNGQELDASSRVAHRSERVRVCERAPGFGLDE